MSYITQRDQRTGGFVANNSVRLSRKRSEGRIKRFDSCLDARAWNVLENIRSTYLLDYVNNLTRTRSESNARASYEDFNEEGATSSEEEDIDVGKKCPTNFRLNASTSELSIIFQGRYRQQELPLVAVEVCLSGSHIEPPSDNLKSKLENDPDENKYLSNSPENLESHNNSLNVPSEFNRLEERLLKRDLNDQEQIQTYKRQVEVLKNYLKTLQTYKEKRDSSYFQSDEKYEHNETRNIKTLTSSVSDSAENFTDVEFVQQLVAELQKKVSTIHPIKKERDHLRNEINRLNNRIKEIDESYNEELDIIIQERNELHNRLSRYIGVDEKLRKLKKQLKGADLLREERDSLINKLKMVTSENDNLSEEKNLLSCSIVNVSAERDKLLNKLQKYQYLEEDLDKLRSTSYEQFKMLEQERNVYKERYKNVKATTVHRERELRKAECIILEQAYNIEGLTAAVSRLSTEKENIKNSVTDITGELCRTSHELRQCKTELDIIKAKVLQQIETDTQEFSPQENKETKYLSTAMKNNKENPTKLLFKNTKNAIMCAMDSIKLIKDKAYNRLVKKEYTQSSRLTDGEKDAHRGSAAREKTVILEDYSDAYCNRNNASAGESDKRPYKTITKNLYCHTTSVTQNIDPNPKVNHTCLIIQELVNQINAVYTENKILKRIFQHENWPEMPLIDLEKNTTCNRVRDLTNRFKNLINENTNLRHLITASQETLLKKSKIDKTQLESNALVSRTGTQHSSHSKGNNVCPKMEMLFKKIDAFHKENKILRSITKGQQIDLKKMPELSFMKTAKCKRLRDVLKKLKDLATENGNLRNQIAAGQLLTSQPDVDHVKSVKTSKAATAQLVELRSELPAEIEFVQLGEAIKVPLVQESLPQLVDSKADKVTLKQPLIIESNKVEKEKLARVKVAQPLEAETTKPYKAKIVEYVKVDSVQSNQQHSTKVIDAENKKPIVPKILEMDVTTRKKSADPFELVIKKDPIYTTPKSALVVDKTKLIDLPQEVKPTLVHQQKEPNSGDILVKPLTSKMIKSPTAQVAQTGLAAPQPTTPPKKVVAAESIKKIDLEPTQSTKPILPDNKKHQVAKQFAIPETVSPVQKEFKQSATLSVSSSNAAKPIHVVKAEPEPIAVATTPRQSAQIITPPKWTGAGENGHYPKHGTIPNTEDAGIATDAPATSQKGVNTKSTIEEEHDDCKRKLNELKKEHAILISALKVAEQTPDLVEQLNKEKEERNNLLNIIEDLKQQLRHVTSIPTEDFQNGFNEQLKLLTSQLSIDNLRIKSLEDQLRDCRKKSAESELQLKMALTVEEDCNIHRMQDLAAANKKINELSNANTRLIAEKKSLVIDLDTLSGRLSELEKALKVALDNCIDASVLAALKQQYETKMNAMEKEFTNSMTDTKKKYFDNISELQRKCERDIESIRKEHEDSIDRMQNVHEEIIQETIKGHNIEISNAMNKKEKLDEEIIASKRCICNLERANQELMGRLACENRNNSAYGKKCTCLNAMSDKEADDFGTQQIFDVIVNKIYSTGLESLSLKELKVLHNRTCNATAKIKKIEFRPNSRTSRSRHRSISVAIKTGTSKLRSTSRITTKSAKIAYRKSPIKYTSPAGFRKILRKQEIAQEKLICLEHDLKEGTTHMHEMRDTIKTSMAQQKKFRQKLWGKICSCPGNVPPPPSAESEIDNYRCRCAVQVMGQIMHKRKNRTSVCKCTEQKCGKSTPNNIPRNRNVQQVFTAAPTTIKPDTSKAADRKSDFINNIKFQSSTPSSSKNYVI